MFSIFKRFTRTADAVLAEQGSAKSPGDLRKRGSGDSRSAEDSRSHGVDTVATTMGLSPAAPYAESPSRPMLSEAEAKRVLQELPDPLELLSIDDPNAPVLPHAVYETPPLAPASPTASPAPLPHRGAAIDEHNYLDELDSSFDKLMAEDMMSTEAAAPTTIVKAPTVASTPFYLRLRAGLKRTGEGITSLFTGTQIPEDLYDDLEGALLMADAGTAATQYLLDDLKQRVKQAKTRDPQAVRTLLEQAIADLLKALEAPFEIGRHVPTVMMVAGVNGAGKTTTIGKLTYHFQTAGMKVILAAGDTFRAAAREQLAVWADRNKVTIISRNEADPASVIYDAVQSGIAKKADVVIADTAGRLPTQTHLMDELKKIQRTISKAFDTAPHEVILVLDGNTGQNALAQVRVFDEALGLTGLVITKLDGTARGGVLCGIARYATTSAKRGKLPVYFIGVGEKLEDLQPFNAAQFAKALVG